MKNFINLNLVKELEIDDKNVEELNKLHFIMNCVVFCHNNTGLMEGGEEYYAEAVEYLEYAMQRKWGFHEARTFHTHYRRLSGESATKVHTI